MKELVETLAAWRAEGLEVGRAVVVRTFGSAPRPEGAVLLLASDGRIAGSVSGGCVEGAAADQVRRARADGHSRVIRYGISDEQAWDVGLACGGTIDVLVEPLVRREVEQAARLAAGLVDAGPGPGARNAGGLAEADSGPGADRDHAGERGRSTSRSAGACAVVTPLPGDAPGPEIGPHPPGRGEPPAPVLVAWEDGRLDGTLGDPALDGEVRRHAADALLRGASRTVEVGERSLFIEAFARRPRIVIVGAVQVAIPLVAIARTMGYETVVVDGRPAFATRERFPDADRLVVGWPDEVAEEIGLGPADAVAVLSHDVKFDEPAIVTALEHGCRYVGAVGSRRTQADRRDRLRGAGVGDEDLARLRGPIGLDLGGRNPAETALSIMSEVVAARYGGTGRPMVERARGGAGGPQAASLAIAPAAGPDPSTRRGIEVR
jgi:xanthine dehydrogenase accessory factor